MGEIIKPVGSLCTSTGPEARCFGPCEKVRSRSTVDLSDHLAFLLEQHAEPAAFFVPQLAAALLQPAFLVAQEVAQVALLSQLTVAPMAPGAAVVLA